MGVECGRGNRTPTSRRWARRLPARNFVRAAFLPAAAIVRSSCLISFVMPLPAVIATIAVVFLPLFVPTVG